MRYRRKGLTRDRTAAFHKLRKEIKLEKQRSKQRLKENPAFNIWSFITRREIDDTEDRTSLLSRDAERVIKIISLNSNSSKGLINHTEPTYSTVVHSSSNSPSWLKLFSDVKILLKQIQSNMDQLDNSSDLDDVYRESLINDIVKVHLIDNLI